MNRVAIWVAFCACSGGGEAAWRPSQAIDTVIIDGAIVARDEIDDTSTVLVRVELDGRIGFGSVRMRSPDVTASLRSPHVVLARARAWQMLAHVLTATPPDSYVAAHHAVTLLPACGAVIPLSAGDAGVMRDEAAVRIGCYVQQHREAVW